MKPRTWERIPSSEIVRLAGRLLKNGACDENGTKHTLEVCKAFTESLLIKQNWACAFSGGDSSHCWNGNSEHDQVASYIRLRWGHKVPRSSEINNQFSNLFLLCERCNNQIQTSRTLEELADELMHKLPVIRKLAEEANAELGQSAFERL
jgi:hypothetical protein